MVVLPAVGGGQRWRGLRAIAVSVTVSHALTMAMPFHRCGHALLGHCEPGLCEAPLPAGEVATCVVPLLRAGLVDCHHERQDIALQAIPTCRWRIVTLNKCRRERERTRYAPSTYGSHTAFTSRSSGTPWCVGTPDLENVTRGGRPR